MRNRSKSVYTERESFAIHKKRVLVNSDHEESENELDEDGTVAHNGSWSLEESQELLKQLEKHLPVNSRVVFSQTMTKFDWSTIKIGNYTAEDVKNQVKILIKPLRKMRTLRDLLSDCNVESIEKTLIDQPKRPQNAYNLFFKDKYEKVKEQLGTSDLKLVSRKLSEMYKALTPKKKQKYLERAEALQAEYDRAYKEFLKKHPEIEREKTKMKRETDKSSKTRIKGPLDVYMQELKDKKEFTTFMHARKQWNLMPMSSKVIYIREFLLSNNDKPRSDLLTKKDLAMLEEFDGRPNKPKSAYMLFCDDIRPELVGMSLSEYGKLAGERWKQLLDEDKKVYKDKADRLKEEFQQKMAVYMKSLTEEQRQEMLVKKKRPSKTKDKTDDEGSDGDDDAKKKQKKPRTKSLENGSSEKKKKNDTSSNQGKSSSDTAASDSDARKKKKKKKLPDPEPEVEPEVPTKKRKKEKHRDESMVEDEFVAPAAKSPKKRRDNEESSDSAASPTKKKKKRKKLERPPKNRFTYFAYKYCNQDYDAAVAGWKDLTEEEKEALEEELNTVKKDFVSSLQVKILENRNNGTDFGDDDIVSCPIKFHEPK